MVTQDEPTDVVVIGAGAAGAAFSWRLSQAGFGAVCLEQGRWGRPEVYPRRRDDRGRREPDALSHDPNARGREEDYPVRSGESDIVPLMHSGVGGGTVHWSGLCERFHPSDFRAKTLDGVGEDWPLSYEELEPYYDLNEEMMGCAGMAGDPANPPRPPRRTGPLPLGRDGLLVAGALDALGWHWWPAETFTAAAPEEGATDRDAAADFSPAGVDTTYWPLATRAGARLRTRCRALEIATGDDGRATGVVYRDREGELHHQPARAVAVACNGIGTPRLLLASRSDRHASGLANSTGLVGKNLMLHPSAMAVGLFEENLRLEEYPPGNVLVSQEFYETDRRRAFLRGYAIQMARDSGPLAAVLGPADGSVPWGARHHAEFERRFGRSVALRILAEDLPESHNQMTLDRALTDSSGLPAPRVRYRVSRNTRLALDHGLRSARRILEAAGAAAVLTGPLLRKDGRHLMGTARMGADPLRSVLNGWGQAWDVDNLFVIDGSAFPTSAAVSPTATVQALALRTADYIARERSDLSSGSAGRAATPRQPRSEGAGT